MVLVVELLVMPLYATLHIVLPGRPDSVKAVLRALEETLFDAAIGTICCGIARSMSIGNTNAANARMSFCIIEILC